MTNIERARRTIAVVCGRGVTDFCVCSGSRNAPLLAVIGATEGIRTFSFVDERSAAFFALGRAKLTRRPAAVITTSGTAVAELLPAVIEAHYSGTPMVVVTADRPQRYRGTGAPQAIVQHELFGSYASTRVEDWDGASALHLNVEFDEPLIDEPIVPWTVGCEKPLRERQLQSAVEPGIEFHKPVVILGGLAADERDLVRDFVLRLNAPVYAEPLSGLREDPSLADLLITSGERMLSRGGFDGVIRIGNVPTLRFWRDLDESRASLPVASFSSLPFPGLCRGEVHPLEALSLRVDRRQRDSNWFELDRSIRSRFERALDEEPESELAMIRALSRDLPEHTRVYLGNSLPVREWDLAATREPRHFAIEANRGANGIDGQLSTFFGQCDVRTENCAILGDLTALYDLNAPWIVSQLDPGTRFRIVIINNRGGRIFERVASLRTLPADVRGRVIDNAHDLHFEKWATMFDIESSVVELRPDLDASRRAWHEYEALWA